MSREYANKKVIRILAAKRERGRECANKKCISGKIMSREYANRKVISALAAKEEKCREYANKKGISALAAIEIGRAILHFY